MQGFIVRDHQDLQAEFQKEMGAWVRDGRIVWEETITEGIKNAPKAFLDLFEGDKMGKALVKV
jgi:NADPH-dependent curcumin reductase CurA